MSNCLSVTVGIQPTGRCEAGTPRKAGRVEAGCARKGSADMVLLCKQGEVTCGCQKGIMIDIGFVCGSGLGRGILHASDGALITYDGKYLIVED